MVLIINNMNQKKLVSILLIVLVVVLAGYLGYVTLIKKLANSTTTSKTSDLSVVLESISPSSGTIGTKVTIRGSGFATENNDIGFVSSSSGSDPETWGYLNGIDSLDGKTLRFKIGGDLSACAYSRLQSDEACIQIAYGIPLGNTIIKVVNKIGVSNNINFIVTGY